MFKELLTVLGSLHTVALLFYCIWTTYRLWGFNVPSIGPLLQCVNCQGAMWTMLYYFYSVLYTVQYTVKTPSDLYCPFLQCIQCQGATWITVYCPNFTVYEVSRHHLNYIFPFLQCIQCQGAIWIILSHFYSVQCQGAIGIILSHFYSVHCHKAPSELYCPIFYSVHCHKAPS